MKKSLEITKRYYGKNYKKIHYTGLLGRFTNFYHSAIEKGHDNNQNFEFVLEIGAGDGEHLRFVSHSFQKYYLLDPYPGETLKDLVKSRKNLKLISAFADDIPLRDSSIDRLICTCVLLHVSDIEQTLIELRRVVKHEGILDLYLPMDPGILYRAIRHITSHQKIAKQMQQDMLTTKYLWANEHKNGFLTVKAMLDYTFQHDKVKYVRYPFRFLSWNFGLFAIVKIKIDKE